MLRGKPGDDPDVVDAYVERPLPSLKLSTTWITALLLCVLGLVGWEQYWRGFGVRPGYRNSDGLWTMQRRRIDAGEGDATVVIGSSRVLFDIQLDTWQEQTGVRPIQLALEGTSPMNVLEDLAADDDFRGRLLVGVTPGLFFSGRGFRHGVVPYARKETLSERASQWLSMRLLEPWLAYYSDSDFALFTVLERQRWPARAGVEQGMRVRKLMVTGPDRATALWDKVERDPEYRELTRSIWRQFFAPAMTEQAAIDAHWKTVDREIDRAVAAVAKLQARGVAVVFVRPPSTGPYIEEEDRDYPRARTWDVLLARSGARGVHFADHAAMQGLTLPEWSHLTRADAERYTRALVDVIEREQMWRAAATAQVPGSQPTNQRPCSAAACTTALIALTSGADS